jgi:hypothetical protein
VDLQTMVVTIVQIMEDGAKYNYNIARGSTDNGSYDSPDNGGWG